MKALFDIIMIWGTKAVNNKCTTEEPLAYLATCLGPTTPEPLRRIAVEGFVKLFASDTVRDEKVVVCLFRRGRSFSLTYISFRFFHNSLCYTLSCETNAPRS